MGKSGRKALSVGTLGISDTVIGNPEQERAMRDMYSELQGMQKPTAASYLRYTDDKGNFIDPNFQLQGGENWVQKAMKAQAAEEAALGNKASTQAAGAQAAQRSMLASRGGLRGGTAERLAKASQRDTAQALQDINMQGMQNRALTERQGEEMNRQAQQFNIGNRLQDIQGQNVYNANKYAQEMQAYGAGKSAMAGLGGQMRRGKK